MVDFKGGYILICYNPTL